MEKYDYREFGHEYELYFDTDYNETLYITDAGRSWGSEKVNLRDKVDSKYNFKFNSTADIISAVEKEKLPDKIIINVHPEHWAESSLEWFVILIKRKIRNFAKVIYLKLRNF